MYSSSSMSANLSYSIQILKDECNASSNPSQILGKKKKKLWTTEAQMHLPSLSYLLTDPNKVSFCLKGYNLNFEPTAFLSDSIKTKWSNMVAILMKAAGL